MILSAFRLRRSTRSSRCSDHWSGKDPTAQQAICVAPENEGGGVVSRASVDSSVRIPTPIVISPSGLLRSARLVNAGRSLPIDNASQVPRIPDEIHLQLSLLIDHKLGRRVQDTRALALVRVVQVELASRQVIGGRSGVPVHLTASEEAVSDKANLPSSWGWNHLDVTTVITQSAGDLDVARRVHLA